MFKFESLPEHICDSRKRQRQAVELGDRAPALFPYFQAIVDVRSSAIVGYECLARMNNQENKAVSAAWLFEDQSLSFEERRRADRLVREQALKRFASDKTAGLLFLNISPRWVTEAKLNTQLNSLRMIDKLGLDPRRVVVEITELGGNMKSLAAAIKAYKRAGLKVAIDDFGAGASQLDRLLCLEPDYLKLDMGLFKRAAYNTSSSRLLMALAPFAEHSSCEIICEGVETEQEYHFALECGAQYVQGWLMAPAQAELLPQHHCYELNKKNQRSYLQRKKQKIRSSVEVENQLRSCVKTIKRAIEIDALYELDAKSLAADGVLRFCLYSEDAEQISARYNVLGGHLSCDYPRASWCWAHRPYLSVVMDVASQSRGSYCLSQSYFDTQAQVLCKAWAAKLDDGRIILLDCVAAETTLFCEEKS
ncbi:EAL domain-containing protein [Agaribacterium haliotis]|uniref:EAL domain-containing protein n=1 Tax=Agaribacterium haliotis TaxID=2013869 RepID=UPI000BB552B6|nr:EAL domain-containing protein [Agaribacterium haliotis]